MSPSATTMLILLKSWLLRSNDSSRSLALARMEVKQVEVYFFILCLVTLPSIAGKHLAVV
jgi:hypothetical protein